MQVSSGDLCALLGRDERVGSQRVGGRGIGIPAQTEGSGTRLGDSVQLLLRGDDINLVDSGKWPAVPSFTVTVAVVVVVTVVLASATLPSAPP